MTRTLILLFAALLLLAGGALPAAAQPRYVDKDAATELARILDKGVFKQALITSTFIQRTTPEQYVIKVVLDNGAEQEWNLHQIRTWSQDGSLTLQKNRQLLFPSKTTNEFAVLDKNAFTQQALTARIFAKRYGQGDVLSGRIINYGVFEFNLARLLKIEGGRDPLGYPYEYVFDLQNGQRELLSAVDAWEVTNRGGLYDNPDAVTPVLTRPYVLTAMRGDELRRIPENGLGEFGVELAFDRDVRLQPDHFPFQVYETPKERRRPEAGYDFVLEVTAPNALVARRIEGIENLEFLKNIHAMTDPNHQNRVLLRAEVNPQVLATPPRVEVRGNVVRVVLTKVEDQSVFDRHALREAELRRRQQKIVMGDVSEQEVRKRQQYLEAMERGRGHTELASAAEMFEDQAEHLRAALEFFRSAATNASSDSELQDALRERNRMMGRLPTLIVEHVQRTLTEGAPSDAQSLRGLLDEATSLTRDPAILERIQDLRTRLQ